MNVCVFTGGEYPLPESVSPFFEQLPDFVIAADSGLDAAELYGSVYGFVPDLIIGDMDSLSEPDLRLAHYESSRVKRFIRDKDYTDTELALKEAYGFCRGSGICRELSIMLIGGDGGRLDHLFAIKNLFGTNLSPHIWLCRAQAVFYLNSAGYSTFTADKITPDDSISVFPVGRAAHSILSQGLMWPLDVVEWDAGQYSLSNRLADDSGCGSRISIRAVSGAFSIIVPLRLHSKLY